MSSLYCRNAVSPINCTAWDVCVRESHRAQGSRPRHEHAVRHSLRLPAWLISQTPLRFREQTWSPPSLTRSSAPSRLAARFGSDLDGSSVLGDRDGLRRERAGPHMVRELCLGRAFDSRSRRRRITRDALAQTGEAIRFDVEDGRVEVMRSSTSSCLRSCSGMTSGSHEPTSRLGRKANSARG